MLHAADLPRRNCRTGQRGKKHPSYGISQRYAVTWSTPGNFDFCAIADFLHNARGIRKENGLHSHKEFPIYNLQFTNGSTYSPRASMGTGLKIGSLKIY